jgi:hypothetical protein
VQIRSGVLKPAKKTATYRSRRSRLSAALPIGKQTLENATLGIGPGNFSLLSLKGKLMNISPNVKPALWGAAGGAVALAILGFTWGGWVTGSTATTMADKQATLEVAKVLAPVCFSQFNLQPGAEAKLVELKGIKSLYEQASFIEKSGAATMPGSDKMAKGVSQACAELLTKVAS